MFKDKQYYMAKVKELATIIGFWTIVDIVIIVLFALDKFIR